MGAKYGVKFSEEEKCFFFQNSSKLSSDESAKEFSFNMPEDQRKFVKLVGVPLDSKISN